MWWSHVQRKANFPPAYRRSISCSVFPEIDRVRGWTKARDWKAINCFFSSAEEDDITIRSCRPQAELSSTCFYDERRGRAWQRISINSGAGNVSLSLLLSPRLRAPSPLFSSSFCLSVLFWSHSQPGLTWIFFSLVFLVQYFYGIHILHLTLPHSLLSVPPFCLCLPLGLSWTIENVLFGLVDLNRQICLSTNSYTKTRCCPPGKKHNKMTNSNLIWLWLKQPTSLIIRLICC